MNHGHLKGRGWYHDLVMALADGPDVPACGAEAAGRDCGAEVMGEDVQTDATDIVTDSGSAAGLIEDTSRCICVSSGWSPTLPVILPSHSPQGPFGSILALNPIPAWQIYLPVVAQVIEYLRDHDMLVTSPAVTGDTGETVEVPADPAPTGEDWRMKRGLRDARDWHPSAPKPV